MVFECIIDYDTFGSTLPLLCLLVASLPCLQTIEYASAAPTILFDAKFLAAFDSHAQLQEVRFIRILYLQSLDSDNVRPILLERAQTPSPSRKSIKLICVKISGHNDDDAKNIQYLSDAGVQMECLDIYSPFLPPISWPANLTVNGLRTLILVQPLPEDLPGDFARFLSRHQTLEGLTLGMGTGKERLQKDWESFPMMKRLVELCNRSGWAVTSAGFERKSLGVFVLVHVTIALERSRNHDDLDELNEVYPELQSLHANDGFWDDNILHDGRPLDGLESAVRFIATILPQYPANHTISVLRHAPGIPAWDVQEPNRSQTELEMRRHRQCSWHSSRGSRYSWSTRES